MELTRCPQCGLVAEVVSRDVWDSTDGPVEHAHVRCVARHRFLLPVAMLAVAPPPEPTPVRPDLVVGPLEPAVAPHRRLPAPGTRRH